MRSGKKAKILIAEDDFIVSEVIRKEIEDLGYKVVGKAPDGRKAVEMTCSLKPDVVIMDIEMPDMDGLEATMHINKTCPTPVVILTAYDTPDLVKQASKMGAGAYLVKMPGAREIERAIAIATARFNDMIALRRANAKLQNRNKALQKALNKVKKLSGLLPICANCKKIRTDDGYWQDVAVYIREHSEADFSHGICPECAEKLYSGYVNK